MGKLTKNQKSVASKIEAGKAYTLKEASQLVKDSALPIRRQLQRRLVLTM